MFNTHQFKQEAITQRNKGNRPADLSELSDFPFRIWPLNPSQLIEVYAS